MGCRATARSSAAAALLAAGLLAASGSRAASIDLSPRIFALASTEAGWETLATGLPEEARLRLRPAFRYNRVDGATPTAGVAFQRERDRAPLVYADVSYATGRDRFLGAIGLEAPFGDPTWLRVGADLYRRTASEDAWIVGENENTVFALVARTDYRDHYEATGGIGRVVIEPGDDASFEVAIRIQNEASLPTRVRVSIFGKDDRFRANPPIEPGDEGLLSFTARAGPRRFVPGQGGVQGSLTVEHAGDPLGRDFDYWRARATVRAVHRFTKRRLVRARVVAGSTRDGRLPLQKIWHVGGIGTLRAHDYKAFSGDQFFVLNAEYLTRVRKNFFPFAFVDWGAAWFGTGNLDRQQPGLDGGLGFRVGEDAVAITVARDLRRGDGPLRVGVRLGVSF